MFNRRVEQRDERVLADDYDAYDAMDPQNRSQSLPPPPSCLLLKIFPKGILVSTYTIIYVLVCSSQICCCFWINDLFHSSCGQTTIYQLHFDLSSKKLLAKAKSNTPKNLSLLHNYRSSKTQFGGKYDVINTVDSVNC